MNTEQLVSRTFPDRRVNTERRDGLDVDLTIPNRRSTDRRADECVIRPATDDRPMANTLTLNAFKRSDARFTGEPVSNFGRFA